MMLLHRCLVDMLKHVVLLWAVSLTNKYEPISITFECLKNGKQFQITFINVLYSDMLGN